MLAAVKNYLKLTKPSIMLLVVLTGGAGLVVERSLLSDPFKFSMVLLGLFPTGGAANALNQYFERDIDAKMKRTARRRPLPTGKIKPLSALIFTITIGIGGCLLLGWMFNLLSALIALGTICFYGFFYTLYLKPNTPQNIVIGGIAGAMAPVIAWTAAAGTPAWPAWLMFAIIFLWTPPHFWALALYLKEDYEGVAFPMMPKVKGERSTLNQMLVYSIVMLPVSILLYIQSPLGYLYLVTAVILGVLFVVKSYLVRRKPSRKDEIGLFKYSILYMLALFAVIIVDALLLGPVK